MILKHADQLYNRRVTKAASALVLRLPFFGYLLFGSTVKVLGENIQTMATDGASVFCGIEFTKKEHFDIVMFGLLHELIHIYFNHAGRRENRDKKRWNIAIDIYTNGQCAELLADSDGKPWPIPKKFIQWQDWAKGLTCEQIYLVLDKQDQETAGSSDQYLPKGGEPGDEVSEGTDILPPPKPEHGKPAGGDPQDAQDFQDAFRQDVAHAKALADKSPLAKPLPTSVVDRMTKIMRPTLPWGSLVRGQISSDLGWDEATYAPPKMRYLPAKIILPQTRSVKERILLLGIDISTSVTDELIKIFISNVEAASTRATEICIVSFDAVVRDHFRTKRPRDIFKHVKFVSGHHTHTSAIGLFDIAKTVKPSAICILTDGHIRIPEEPVRNTTFVIPEGGNILPWGKTFVMEHPWR